MAQSNEDGHPEFVGIASDDVDVLQEQPENGCEAGEIGVQHDVEALRPSATQQNGQGGGDLRNQTQSKAAKQGAHGETPRGVTVHNRARRRSSYAMSQGSLAGSEKGGVAQSLAEKNDWGRVPSDINNDIESEHKPRSGGFASVAGTLQSHASRLLDAALRREDVQKKRKAMQRAQSFKKVQSFAGNAATKKINDSPYFQQLFKAHEKEWGHWLTQEETEKIWIKFAAEVESAGRSVNDLNGDWKVQDLHSTYDESKEWEVWPALSIHTIPNFLLVNVRHNFNYDFIRDALEEFKPTHTDGEAKVDVHSRRGSDVSDRFARGMPAKEKEDVSQDRVRFPTLLSMIVKIKRAEAEANKTKFLPIDESSHPKQCWDFLVMMCLFYTCFSVPYLLAFDTDDVNDWTPFTIFDFMLDIIFLIDVAFSCVTTYVDEGRVVFDMRMIFFHYAKNWMVLDLLGSFPIDKVIVWQASSMNTSSEGLESLRLLKVVRMLKLVRAIRLVRFLDRLQSKEGFQTLKKAIQIGKCVFLMLFMAHCIGCIFTMLIVDPNDNWLVSYDPTALTQTNFRRYLMALYWSIISITTMGYGDILPVTNEERLFVIFVAVVGAVVFSYTMGTLTQLVTSSSNAEMAFDAQLSSSSAWLEWRRFSPSLKLKMTHYLHATVHGGPRIFEETAHLTSASSSLRRQLYVDMSNNAIELQGLNFLQGLEPEIRGAVISKLSIQVIPAGDTVYKALDSGGSIYCLISGRMVKYECENLLDDLLTPVDHDDEVIILEGDTFGESSLFLDICSKRAETVTAITYSKLAVLSMHDIIILSNDYPEIEQRLRENSSMQAIWTGWNEDSAQHEIEKFKAMKVAREREFLWSVRQTTSNISQSVRLMKLETEKSMRQLDQSKYVAFDAWLCLYPFEVELARKDPSHAPLSDFSKSFPGELWVNGTFLICQDRNVFHMADTQYGVANDFQNIGRLAIGSKLEIAGEQKDRDISHHANRVGTPMMMARTASNNCDMLSRIGSEGTQAFSHIGLGGLQRIPTDLMMSMDLGLDHVASQLEGIDSNGFEVNADSPIKLKRPVLRRRGFIGRMVLVDIPPKSLKGPKAMIAFEKEDDLKRISKQIEDLMSDAHISPDDVEASGGDAQPWGSLKSGIRQAVDEESPTPPRLPSDDDATSEPPKQPQSNDGMFSVRSGAGKTSDVIGLKARRGSGSLPGLNMNIGLNSSLSSVIESPNNQSAGDRRGSGILIGKNRLPGLVNPPTGMASPKDMLRAMARRNSSGGRNSEHWGVQLHVADSSTTPDSIMRANIDTPTMVPASPGFARLGSNMTRSSDVQHGGIHTADGATTIQAVSHAEFRGLSKKVDSLEAKIDIIMLKLDGMFR